jgi:hypothetical protein
MTSWFPYRPASFCLKRTAKWPKPSVNSGTEEVALLKSYGLLDMLQRKFFISLLFSVLLESNRLLCLFALLKFLTRMEGHAELGHCTSVGRDHFSVCRWKATLQYKENMIGSRSLLFCPDVTGAGAPSFSVQKRTRGLLLSAGNYPLIEPLASRLRPIFVPAQRGFAKQACTIPDGERDSLTSHSKIIRALGISSILINDKIDPTFLCVCYVACEG